MAKILDAIRLLEEAAAALPNRAVVHYHLGMAYIATKQLSKAAEQLNAALNQSPDDDAESKNSKRPEEDWHLKRRQAAQI